MGISHIKELNVGGNQKKIPQNMNPAEVKATI
jgi:hypothetical protein